MKFRSFRDESRVNWGRTTDGNLSDAELQVGALLRIADATEKMAKRHDELIAEIERLQRMVKIKGARIDKLEHQNAGLRGYISRMKRGDR